MNRRFRAVTILVCLAAFVTGSFHAQQKRGAAAAAQPTSPPVSDFAWLQGYWTGTLGSAQLEQYFSPVTGGVIVGIFRLVQSQQDPLLEFSVLRETPDGLELRLRHFDPDLKPVEGADPILLRFSRRDADRFTFENPINGQPKLSTLERKADGSFHAHSEIVRSNATLASIDVDWHRQTLDLPAPATLAAAAPFSKNDIATLAWFAGHWRSTFGGGEVHEFWLAPAGNVMAGALCPVSNGKVDGCEFSSLEPGTDALVGRTWQLDGDMRIGAAQRLIEAPVVGGTAESVDFRGNLPKNYFTEKVERVGPGGMHKKLEIFKPDGSSAQVIELNANRVETRAAAGTT